MPFINYLKILKNKETRLKTTIKVTKDLINKNLLNYPSSGKTPSPITKLDCSFIMTSSLESLVI